MNIFVTSDDPWACARALDNVRLNKMGTETIQLLSTAIQVRWRKALFPGIWKPTHVNHPCALWVRQSRANYAWLHEHGVALMDEFMVRYGRERPVAPLLDKLKIRGKGCPLDWANCSRFKEIPVFEAYRETLRCKWNEDKRDPQWGSRGAPPWRQPHLP
jgi:hypothetical protein